MDFLTKGPIGDILIKDGVIYAATGTTTTIIRDATSAIMELEGPTANVISLAVDEGVVFSGSWDGTIYSYEAATGKALIAYRCPEGHISGIRKLVVTPQLVAAVTYHSWLIVWDRATGVPIKQQPVYPIKDLGGEVYTFTQFPSVFATSEGAIAVGSHEGHIRVFKFD